LLAGLNQSRQFRLNLSRLKVAPGMARSSARNGLRRLEDAGLVTVARPAGQRVLVAIIVTTEPLLDPEQPRSTRAANAGAGKKREAAP